MDQNYDHLLSTGSARFAPSVWAEHGRGKACVFNQFSVGMVCKLHFLSQSSLFPAVVVHAPSALDLRLSTALSDERRSNHDSASITLYYALVLTPLSPKYHPGSEARMRSKTWVSSASVVPKGQRAYV